MLDIRLDPHYVRDYKKLKKDNYNVKELDVVMEKIADERSLNEYYDHSLIGDLQGFRELHVDKKKRSNWLLLYAIVNNAAIFYKTGSHDYVVGKR
jgi:YafQ family addiction module toxin component